MATSSAIARVLEMDVATVAEAERLEALAATGGQVDLGEPLALADLLALADVTPGDVARAGADWQATTPSWAQGLLDAKAVG